MFNVLSKATWMFKTFSSLFIYRRDLFRKVTLRDHIYYRYNGKINAVFFNTWKVLVFHVWYNIFIDLQYKKILSEKTKLQHDLLNHLEERKRLEYDLSSYKKRLARQNRTGIQMENGYPLHKTKEGNTMHYCSKYIIHFEDENDSTRNAEETRQRSCRALVLIAPLFSCLCLRQPKGNKSYGSAVMG